MNKHLAPLVLIVAIFFGNTTVNAQACGGGTFIFKFSGEKTESINYEVLPVKPDSESRIKSADVYHGTMVDHKDAERIIDTLFVTELDKALAMRGNQKAGEVKAGVIKFATLETAHFSCLLKLSSNGKVIYILANLVGGCNRTTTIIWDENPRISGY